MSDFDYGNARLRAMRSRLLTRTEMLSLAENTQLQGLIAALFKTPYRHAVEAAISHSIGLTCITEALHIDLIETLGRLRRFYEGDALEQLMVLLRRYDVHNIKAILRGKSNGVATAEIAATLIPVGDLTMSILEALLDTSDARAVIDALATMRMPIAQPLLNLRGEHPGARVAEMELGLDHWYFEEAHHTLREMSGEVGALTVALDLDADRINLLTALRFAHAPTEHQMLRIAMGTGTLQALFVKPGRLSLRQLTVAGAQQSLVAAVEALGTTSYQGALARGMALYQQSGRLSDIERQLNAFRLHALVGLIGREPLGFGVPVGFIALKMSEFANIRWIARAIATGLNADDIKQDLEFTA